MSILFNSLSFIHVRLIEQIGQRVHISWSLQIFDSANELHNYLVSTMNHVVDLLPIWRNLQEVCHWQLKADRQKFTSAISPKTKTSRTWNITQIKKSDPSLSLYLLKTVKVKNWHQKFTVAILKFPKPIARKRPS